MSILNYRDFIIYVDYAQGTNKSTRPGKFSLRVFDSPVGEGERDEEVTITNWKRLEGWRKSLADRAISPGDLEKFARRLGDLILPPYARGLYEQSLARLAEGDGLRVRLRLPDELALLPWEYALVKLHGGEITPEDYWALAFRISIVRHEAISIPAPPFRANPSRRVVVAMASPKPYQKYQKLNLGGEQRAIKSALDEMAGLQVEYHPDFDRKDQPVGATEDMILKAMQNYADIFHFSGHGIFKPRLGRGAIILSGPGNRGQEVRADLLGGLLAEGRVRLVVLDACETGERDMFLRWSSIATALLRGGIPAVVAMQFSIYDDLGKQFAEKLYKYLVAGLTIDEAVAQGRKAMYRKNPEQRDWGAPVLYLRNSGGNIFPPVTNEQARLEAEQTSMRDTTLGEVSMRWARNGALANPAQLEILEKGGDSLGLAPLDAVLLLRSAVESDQETAYWVAQLHKVGAQWLEQIQAKPRRGEERGLAERHLGLGSALADQRPKGVSALTWSAVTNPDTRTGQTAALALLALQPEQAVAQIQNALRSVGHSAARRRRRAALLGSLAEADLSVAKGLPSELDNVQDRVAVWWWRARKHIRHNQSLISRWAVGGALGAGLALAIYRALLAVFNALPIGTEFAVNSYWGFIAGLGLVFGLVIAPPLLLQDAGRPERGKARNPILLSMLLAALGFSLANALVVWMNGIGLTLPTFLRSLVTAFLVGIGLSLGLFRQPEAGWRLGPGGWLLRLGAAAALLAIAQLPVLCETALRADGRPWLGNGEWLAASIIEPRQALVDIYRLYPFLDTLFSQGASAGAGQCCFASASAAGPFGG